MELLLPQTEICKKAINTLFTFQYGATSTNLLQGIANNKIDLHSNMELLLRIKSLYDNTIDINLHSNMELLLPFTPFCKYN